MVQILQSAIIISTCIAGLAKTQKQPTIKTQDISQNQLGFIYELEKSNLNFEMTLSKYKITSSPESENSYGDHNLIWRKSGWKITKFDRSSNLSIVSVSKTFPSKDPDWYSTYKKLRSLFDSQVENGILKLVEDSDTRNIYRYKKYDIWFYFEHNPNSSDWNLYLSLTTRE